MRCRWLPLFQLSLLLIGAILSPGSDTSIVVVAAFSVTQQTIIFPRKTQSRSGGIGSRGLLSSTDWQRSTSTSTRLDAGKELDATCVLRKKIGKQDMSFSYKATTLELPDEGSAVVNDDDDDDNNDTSPPLGILLIHPIGVGIAKWYYERLLEQLSLRWKNDDRISRSATVLVPDLLASGSASEATVGNEHDQTEPTIVKKLPLITVTDWTEQMMQLIDQFEKSNMSNKEDTDAKPMRWCVVSNGGCVPVALSVAAALETDRPGLLESVVLSSPPSLPALLRDAPRPEKVQKSYRTLSGLVGKIFWWYALRRDGRFVEKFSQKNLAADPANFGPDWTKQCVDTCKETPKSRFSTFAFLAGALQTDCRPALDMLRNQRPTIDVILGSDRRRNPARSWFWSKRKPATSTPEDEQDEDQQDQGQDQQVQRLPETVSLAQYLDENGNRGREARVGGRRCPAYEDAEGFAEAMIGFIIRD